jgi:hypothetical protein
MAATPPGQVGRLGRGEKDGTMVEDLSRAGTILEGPLVEDPGNGVYLGPSRPREPDPAGGDYFTTYIGRQLVVSRDKQGEVHCLVNACSHCGAMLCGRKTDNRTTFTCPFHGWTFSNSGRLLKVKDLRDAGYPEQFNTDGSHDLTKAARFESYREFLFGSRRLLRLRHPLELRGPPAHQPRVEIGCRRWSEGRASNVSRGESRPPSCRGTCPSC